MVKEAHSLEEWGKIVDNALRETSGINNNNRKTVPLYDFY